jgi:hypothetical protein
MRMDGKKAISLEVLGWVGEGREGKRGMMMVAS